MSFQLFSCYFLSSEAFLELFHHPPPFIEMFYSCEQLLIFLPIILSISDSNIKISSVWKHDAALRTCCVSCGLGTYFATLHMFLGLSRVSLPSSGFSSRVTNLLYFHTFFLLVITTCFWLWTACSRLYSSCERWTETCWNKDRFLEKEDWVKSAAFTNNEKNS